MKTEAKIKVGKLAQNLNCDIKNDIKIKSILIREISNINYTTLFPCDFYENQVKKITNET